MYLQLATTAYTAVHSAASSVLAAGPCPSAPPGLQHYADQVTGWVK